MNESSQGVLWLSFPKENYVFWMNLGGVRFCFCLQSCLEFIWIFTEKTWWICDLWSAGFWFLREIYLVRLGSS